jgi:hypothetical protein
MATLSWQDRNLSGGTAGRGLSELHRGGKRHVVKVYPAEMPEDQQGHCFGGARGMHVWAQDALAFFAGALR